MNVAVQKQLEQCLDSLGVDSSYSWDDIEKQYRQLIQRWHPDRNSGDDSELAQERFIEINTAYKQVREHYKLNGSVPRHIPKGKVEPILGAKKSNVEPAANPFKKALFASLFAMTLLIMFGVVLWSLDSRLAENNRDRANIEKSSTVQQDRVDKQSESKAKLTQSASDIEL